uniref:Myocardin n=1 Tax=Nothobranchius rachovii TaxID=451742 RepID=A0A1A8S2M9_9TELE
MEACWRQSKAEPSVFSKNRYCTCQQNIQLS